MRGIFQFFTIFSLFLIGYSACTSYAKNVTAKKTDERKQNTKIKVYGAKKVSKIFGIPLKKIKVPPIPWNKKELAQEAKRGRVLILRACPEGYPNSIATMLKKYPQLFYRTDYNLINIDYNVSACNPAQTKWIISDFFPYQWTADKSYGEQLTEALKRHSHSKLLTEVIYDYLLMKKDYRTMKQYMAKEFFVTRSSSSFERHDIYVIIPGTFGRITLGPTHPLARNKDLFMLTQSF